MEEVLVSVVVPVFGVEKYIERCARSLFEQTLPEMEFIFVDDCTKDRSIEILERVLEEYPHRHGQIHIVHHENNKGLPQARKTGIQLAKGQYIAHCDSDDWVDRDMYRSMYNVARCKNADIVFCDFLLASDYGNKAVLQNTVDCCDNGYLILELLNDNIHGGLWRVLTSRQLYGNDLFYPYSNMCEDLVMNMQLLNKAHAITWLHEPYYYYYQNVASISNGFILNKFQSFLKNIDLLVAFFEGSGFKEKDSYAVMAKLRARLMLNPFVGQYYQLWRDTYPEIEGKVLSNKLIKPSFKIKYILGYLRLYGIVWKLFKR